MTTIFFQQIQSHDAVRFVEEDGIAYADDVTWGIDRVDQRNLPLDNSYTPYGEGINGRVGFYCYC